MQTLHRLYASIYSSWFVLCFIVLLLPCIRQSRHYAKLQINESYMQEQMEVALQNTSADSVIKLMCKCIEICYLQ